MYQVKCIKCGQQYDSSDPDPYYCATCEVEKKKIAAEVDEKMKSNPKKEITSGIKQYDSLPKVHGFVNAKYFL